MLFRSRWNRLENLLRNARDNSEYDLDLVLDQTLEFVFSDRGLFLRDRIVSELINSLDFLGQNSLRSTATWLQNQLGLRVEEPAPDSTSDLTHLIRILEIIKDTQGFDTIKLASRLPALLFKPETQTMGQQVISGLVQRGLARLIRRLLMGEGTEPRLPIAGLPGAIPILNP